VEKFKLIFEGLDVAYGQHQSERKRADGKEEGKSYIVKKIVTEELWEAHIAGEGPSLGIIPIMADNTARWGCIDIDTYPIDYRSIINSFRKLQIPLVPCRSKSGGIHLFLFFKKPIAAKLIREKLREVAAALGHADVEVFPKQSTILIEKGDLGNFLNLPYYNAKNSTRYAYKDDGTAASLLEFIELYNKYSIDDIDKVAIQVSGDVIKDGPPCLQQLCTQGFPEGTRNNGLFNIGVYLRKFDADKWKILLEEYNRNYMNPPLAAAEVIIIQKQLEKKDYNYRCKEPPINSYCNAKVCRTRKHGISGNGASLEFSALTKLQTDPPVWFLDVGDTRMELQTEELQIQTKFQKKCMNSLDTMPPLVKQSVWQEIVERLMNNLIKIPVSDDGSLAGQFEAHLQEFCTDRAQALNRDELLLRKPWTEEGTTWFRLKDLQDYLTRNKFTFFNTGQLVQALRHLKGKSEKYNLKGRTVRVWGVPAYQTQDSAFDVKEIDSAPF
jgi:hypothetical protein